MNFQPFGYPFDVWSPRSPREVRAAIRSRKTRWFDQQTGARGWIVGPFICLWLCAFDRYGPMLFGVISKDNFGTRVRGRAGSDLNGTVATTLFAPIVLLWLIDLARGESQASPQFILLGVLIFIGVPLSLWFSHKDRLEAEPLVRFLNDAITPSGAELRRKSANVSISKGLMLSVSEERVAQEVTASLIYDTLLALSAHRSVLLESSPENYMQTAIRDGSYVIEKREGSSLAHFKAVRRTGARVTGGSSAELFNFEEVLETFLAYASGAEAPTFLAWEPLQLPS